MVPVTYRYLSCNEISYLLDNASYCLLGLSLNDENDPDDNQPYVIPMCYCYSECNGLYTFILYTYNEGMKWQYLESNPKICLEFNWRNQNGVNSVIALGTAEINDADNCVRSGKQLKSIVLRTRNVTGRKYYNLNNLN